MNGLLDSLPLRLPARTGRTRTIDLFLRDGAEGLTTDERAQVRELGRSRHGALRGPAHPARNGGARGRLGGARHEVMERRAVVALAKGDILEARLLPHEGDAPLLRVLRLPPAGGPPRHPQGGEAAHRGRAAGAGGPTATSSWRSSPGWRFRLERYRNVRVESIYDFDAPQGRPAV